MVSVLLKYEWQYDKEIDIMSFELYNKLLRYQNSFSDSNLFL
jgi:hypothetical protein